MIYKIEQFIADSSWLQHLSLLLLRGYLGFLFVQMGMEFAMDYELMVSWFGSEWGLNLIYPEVLLILAIIVHVIAGSAIVLGICTRLAALSLSVVLTIAMIKVHLKNGWYFLANTAEPMVEQRLQKITELIQSYDNYDWMTEYGDIAIHANGIEFAVLYLIGLLILVSFGSGDVSLDSLIKSKTKPKRKTPPARKRRATTKS